MQKPLAAALTASLFALLPFSAPLHGQATIDVSSALRWRSVGPFRAGRVSAVAGVAGNPALFYFGTPGGGVWKTSDGGMIWTPISDAMPVASIGAIGVAASDPRVVYVGTGDVSEVGGSVNAGDGVYKSTDGGSTWTHVGLDRTWHIGALWIDPSNPDVVVVAALGHTFSKDADRGVYKTSDGGKTWRKTLYVDEETGAIDVAFAPDNARLGFATVWGHYVAPGATGAILNGTNRGGVYQTIDGGDTWTRIDGRGLPTERVGRSGVAVARGGRRAYAIVAAQGGGLFRTDDQGASWRRTTSDPRIAGNGYFSKVYVDPANADVVYVMQTSMYKSVDGGRTFVALKGAPGGDDNHVLWIDPTHSDWMIMGSDQGGVVSLDGGKSWTSWYNQPTGQLYHLSTDNRWPYWIYGMQQDSGSIGTRSRGDYGNVGILDWDAVAGYEFGYIVPDPTDPDIVYAGGEARGLWRLDRRSRQVRTISPNVSRDGDYRTAVNPPLAFDPHDPHALYEGTQFVLVTKNGGESWLRISPDLTARADAPPPSSTAPTVPGGYPSQNRTAVNTLAISPVKRGVVWAGTTNGLVHLTQDGGTTWRDVSPPGLTRFHQVSIVEASHFDAGTAYAAVEGHETDDFTPHIFRTHDSGATWQPIVAGIPDDGSFVRVVREDPARRGLLYAGTERGVMVSFDEGDHWQPLQLNLPVVSVRDLVVHDNDLAICTFGRAIWVLDDVTPLRELDRVSASAAHLFAPHPAIRVRRNDNNDTPIPPDLPAAENPPTGAVIDYSLPSNAGEVALAVYDREGRLVRRLSSVPPPERSETAPNVPDYWLATPAVLGRNPGVNRAVWDLRYAPPAALTHSLPISATVRNTPEAPLGPLASPGTYEVRLEVGAKVYRQPLTIVADPRVRVPQADFDRQSAFELKIVAAMQASFGAYNAADALRKAVDERIHAVEGQAAARDGSGALRSFAAKVAALASGGSAAGGGRPRLTFSRVNGDFGTLLEASDLADGAPTEAMTTAFSDYCRDLASLAADWNALVGRELSSVNARLAAAGTPAIAVPPTMKESAACSTAQ